MLAQQHLRPRPRRTKRSRTLLVDRALRADSCGFASGCVFASERVRDGRKDLLESVGVMRRAVMRKDAGFLGR